MSAGKIIYFLLANDLEVSALTGTRIMGGIIPQATPLPAIAFNHLASVERNKVISLNENISIISSVMEVSAHTKSYAQTKALLFSVRNALRNRRGTLAGFVVHSVLMENIGPDLVDDDAKIYSQSIDFQVTYAQPNA